MREAFAFGLDDFLYFGGYPGAAGLVSDPERWGRNVRDSLFETTISRDMLLLTAGGMVTGLPKYAGETVRQRGSSPKFQVFTTALMTAQAGLTPGEVLADPEWRGHLVESAVGAHLLAAQSAGECRVFYWLDRNREPDFVVERGRRLTAIEVKGGRKKGSLPGLAAFTAAFKPDRSLLVGGDGIAVGRFPLPARDRLDCLTLPDRPTGMPGPAPTFFGVRPYRAFRVPARGGAPRTRSRHRPDPPPRR